MLSLLAAKESLHGKVVEACVKSCVTYKYVTVSTPGGVEEWDVRVVVFCKQVGGRLLTITLQNGGQDTAKLHQIVRLVLQEQSQLHRKVLENSHIVPCPRGTYTRLIKHCTWMNMLVERLVNLYIPQIVGSRFALPDHHSQDTLLNPAPRSTPIN